MADASSGENIIEEAFVLNRRLKCYSQSYYRPRFIRLPRFIELLNSRVFIESITIYEQAQHLCKRLKTRIRRLNPRYPSILPSAC